VPVYAKLLLLNLLSSISLNKALPLSTQKVRVMATTTATGQHPDLEKTTSRRLHTDVPLEELHTSDADAELLGR
jgi:hypothetical protein